jgi:hypothetical protein
MVNEDQAYKAIAQALLYYIGDNKWDSCKSVIAVYDGMTSPDYYYYDKGIEYDYLNGNEVPIKAAIDESDACFYLRDDLLQKTGSRIWGLTFTLYPTGKFNIDYDYNKPEDYEESDEQITGAQANESLFKLGFRGKSESNE